MKQSGNSLIEFLLVTVVILAVTASILALAGQTDKKRVNEELSDLATLTATAERALGMPQGHYEGLPGKLIDEKLVPAKMVDSAGHLQSRWGPVNLVPIDVGAKRLAGYSITYTNVPSPACPLLVKGGPKDKRSIRVDSVEVCSFGNINASALAQACSKATVSITFEHHLNEPGKHSL
ncbi:hypothetical protein ERT44_18965 [Stenotrophomonas sp. MA5]|uniref:type 4 pilus major pilin n=1 Tax=Stenotrophomonas TaxID=40323 RepID=UPI001009FE61|nr:MULTISPECIES: type 4 pilus major pilin [Stenotrophomonas]RXK63126.1 hypothetical protein ERT44_18965 [Stenotrophomonas sp. MA5]